MSDSTGELPVARRRELLRLATSYDQKSRHLDRRTYYGNRLPAIAAAYYAPESRERINPKPSKTYSAV
jgi:hypothetical protein